MAHRYDETARIDRLRKEVAEEEAVLGRLRKSLAEWKPTDKRGWTHYDHAHFTGISKGDIQGAIYRVESRIEHLRRQIVEAERRHGLTEDEIFEY